MPDNTRLPLGTEDGALYADDVITDGGVADGARTQRVKIGHGTDSNYKDTSATDPLPVTAVALPLPSGAATEATLAGVKTGTDKIPAAPAEEHVTAGSPHAVRLTDGSAFYKATTPADTQPVSVGSLPLPSGAATEATLSTLNGKVAAAKTADLDTGGGTDTVQITGIALPGAGGAVAGGTATNPVRTDPTGTTTQPISAASLPLPSGAAQEHTAAGSPHAARLTDGSAFYKATTPADTQPVSAASLPLPTGAATEATLSTLNGKVVAAKTADLDTGAGTDTVQLVGIALPKAGGAVAGGTSGDPVRVDPTGTTTQPISAASLPLPTGAAQEHTAAGSPSSARLSDGSAFYKATTPADTQPVSIAATVTVDSELPAAAALADGASNATTPTVGAANLAFNGTTWDRVRGDTANGLDVDVTRLPALPAGTNNIGDVDVLTLPALVAGSAVIGKVRLRNPGDTVDIGDGTNPVRTDPTGTTAQPVTQATAANLNAEVQGDAAHGANVSGNPVLNGLEARTTLPTAVTDGQAVRAGGDKDGRVVTCPHSPRELVDENNITLSSTTETTLLTAVASIFLDLTMLIVSNTSSTGVRVDFRDDTGGTVRLSVFAAANGGGSVMAFQVPKKQGTVNKNWTAQLSGAVTDVRIFAQAVRRH